MPSFAVKSGFELIDNEGDLGHKFSLRAHRL
jgi:hypothetical protein